MFAWQEIHPLKNLYYVHSKSNNRIGGNKDYYDIIEILQDNDLLVYTSSKC